MSPECKVCGRTDGELFLTEGGHICAMCQADEDQAESADQVRWGAAIAPVAILMFGGLMILLAFIPGVGLFSAPLACIAGLIATVLAINNFLEDDAPDEIRLALIGSGALGFFGGIGLLMLGFAMFLSAVLDL